MNAFCGAVDYKEKYVDFSVVQKMSEGFKRIADTPLTARVVEHCAIIFCNNDLHSAPDFFEPSQNNIGGQSYVSAAISSYEDQSLGSEFLSLSETLTEGYVGGGMRYIESLCASVSAVIFNGAYGETVLVSDRTSEVKIYYTLRGSTLYFSSELKALLCAIEIYDGSVKINKAALRRHVLSPYELFPKDLFCSVKCVRAGEGIIFTELGISEFLTEGALGSYENYCQDVSDTSPAGECNVCVAAEKMLEIFGYPIFDAYMPTLAERLEQNKNASRVRRVIYENIPMSSGIGRDYLAERAEVIGRIYGVSLISGISDKKESVKALLRSLRAFYRSYRELENALAKKLENKNCILFEIFEKDELENMEILKREKKIPARIRLAGMLYQTAEWFEKYNLSF